MLDKEVKDLLPETMRKAMESITLATNATDEITLPTLLSVATFATQGLYDCDPLQFPRRAISNYFCVLVPSGGLKTSIMDMALEGARRFEDDQRRVSDQSRVDYEVAMKKYDLQKKDRSRATWDINDPMLNIEPLIMPKPPRGSRYMSSKFTLNGIINALAQVPHFGIFNSDAGEFFNSHAFQKEETGMEIISALSRLWSGEQIDKLTGMEDVITSGKRTTALFMLQQELAGFFENERYRDQGFTNRILITQSELVEKPTVTINKESLRELKRIQVNIEPFNDRVYELLAKVDQLQNQPRTNPKLEIKRQMELESGRDINRLILDAFPVDEDDEETLKIYDWYYKKMQTMTRDKNYSMYTNYFTRAYEHFCRLATVLAIFEGEDKIRFKQAACAAGLMEYFNDQRLNLNIDGAQRTDVVVERANKLHKWILKWDFTRELNKSVLNDYGPSFYKKLNMEQRSHVIQELSDRGLITIEQIGKKVKILAVKTVEQVRQQDPDIEKQLQEQARCNFMGESIGCSD